MRMPHRATATKLICSDSDDVMGAMEINSKICQSHHRHQQREGAGRRYLRVELLQSRVLTASLTNDICTRSDELHVITIAQVKDLNDRLSGERVEDVARIVHTRVS